jgi:hypothetical protein
MSRLLARNSLHDQADRLRVGDRLDVKFLLFYLARYNLLWGADLYTDFNHSRSLHALALDCGLMRLFFLISQCFFLLSYLVQLMVISKIRALSSDDWVFPVVLFFTEYHSLQVIVSLSIGPPIWPSIVTTSNLLSNSANDILPWPP